MKLAIALFAATTLAAPLCAQAVLKPAAKPTPTGAPPGYEIAKFVLPQIPYLSGPVYPVNWKTTAESWKRRGPVYLPKGSANVALHKPVTSSDDSPIIGSLAMAVDGAKEAPRGTNEQEPWVELGPGTQWMQVDLQQFYDIHGILLWHYFFELPKRVYRDVIIRLSDDADFTKNVRTVYNNDDDNSSGFGKGADREFYESYQGQWIPIKAQKARFVRLYSRGNSADPQNQYVEAEVWATPAKVSAPRANKLTLLKPSYAPLPHKSVPAFTPVKPPPAPKTAPPGYEIARFVLPPPPYGRPPINAPHFVKRGPVYLPKGSKNVALHKPVTASDAAPIIGDLTLITNGEKGAEEGQWVQIGSGALLVMCKNTE